MDIDVYCQIISSNYRSFYRFVAFCYICSFFVICVVMFLYLCLIGCSLRFICNEDMHFLTPTRFVICLSRHYHHHHQNGPFIIVIIIIIFIINITVIIINTIIIIITIIIIVIIITAIRVNGWVCVILR
jgi:hypothetical protein